jgi:hypothetical protein
MSVRAALVLGLFLLLAALVHGGLYSAGQDFVVNRFTGEFQFVPAEEEGDTSTPIVAHHHHHARHRKVRPRPVSAP